MNTPTPRTDAAQWFDPMCDFLFVVPADLACQLELELTAVTKERDELKEALIEMRYGHTDKAEQMAIAALGLNDELEKL